MGLPPFEARVRRLAVELFAPDPHPRIESRPDKAWLELGRGGIWGTHGNEKLTHLTLLAHKYRLYAQIQLQDTAQRLLLLPRNATPGDPAFHPGLGDLVVRAYAAAGKSAPPLAGQLEAARMLLHSLLTIAETFTYRDELSEQESADLDAAKLFLERTRP